MITRTFKLCLNAGTGSAPFINVSQTDKDEVWLFELYTETGERYIPSSGAIIGIKADGHGIANTGTVDSEGRVVITETEQMTAAAGRSIFELSIDGLTHGTANFIVNVEKKPIDGAIMSDSDLSLISQAIDSAAVIVDVIGDGDPSEVIGEHVDAWLDNHPEATTTVLDGAITAPKINSTLWDKLLVSEEASGAVASFDDGADDVPVSSLKVALEPVQLGSGDPSPSNVRPIIASNRKNMLSGLITTSETDYGVTFTYNGNGIYTANGTNSSSSVLDYKLTGIGTYRLDLPVGNYVLNGGAYGTNGTANTLYITIRDANNQIRYIGNNGTADSTFSIAEGEYISSVFIRVASGATANNLVFKPMIRLASITDSTYQPYQGIMVEQAGKNLYPKTEIEGTSSGVTVTYDSADGSYTINGVSTAYKGFASVSPFLLKAGTYYLSATASQRGTRPELRSADGSTTYIADTGSFTLDNDTEVKLRIVIGESGITFNNFKVAYQIELGTEATAYEPYTSTSYPMSLGQSVYGGTVDLATGVLTVDRGFVTLTGDASENWYLRSDTTGQYYVTNKTTDAFVISTPTQATVNGVQSNQYKSGTWAAFNRGTADIALMYGSTSVIFRNTSLADVSAVRTYLASNPLQVVYLLANPTTIQLTPTEVKTLLGYNNISSSGTVDVIYHADTKLYVDKMAAVDNSVIAPTEETFTATRNYTVNDLVIVNDTLYKVTANIASGSAITPNSNVQQTTLGALIKALS